MCMLFVKPKNLLLPQCYIDSLQDHNADGVSIYDLGNGEMFKTMDYLEASDYLKGSQDKELVVHFRFGTSGVNTTDQLHGWDIINSEYLFFHNGVLNTFNGNIKTGKSDTQQFVDFANKFELSLDEIVEYLETFEQGSRFILVKKSDSSIIKPDCAKWNEDILINGVPVKFSNTYAIDYHLLQDDGHLVEKKQYKAFVFGKGSTTYNNGYKSTYDNIDDINDDERFDRHDSVNDEDYSDIMQIAELQYLIDQNLRKEVIEFITINPSVVATMLMDGY